MSGAAGCVLQLLLFLILFFIASLLRPQVLHDRLAPPAPRPCSTSGENGLWLHHGWYFGEYPREDVWRLADHLCSNHIRYAYFHVRYITRDGTLRFHFQDEARGMLEVLHQQALGVKAVAWIYAGNHRGAGHVVLDDPDVRANMTHEAASLVEQCGFDGIQWDYEACKDGDPAFLSLLKETRSMLPPDALLSVAAPLWSSRPERGWGWSDHYFGQVAARCNQLVVMCYNTGSHHPDRFRGMVRQQIIHVSRAVKHGNPVCQFLLGIPAYHDREPSHDPTIESVENTLQALREGVSHHEWSRVALAGVAPFADYAMTPSDWAAYRLNWLHESPWAPTDHNSRFTLDGSLSSLSSRPSLLILHLCHSTALHLQRSPGRSQRA